MASCQVLNNMGVVMDEVELEESSETLMDISSLPSGMYMIKILSSDGTILELEKLIIR